MRFVFALMIAGAALAAEDSPAPKETPEVLRSAAKPPGIPAGAVEIQAGIFGVTDAAGVKWLYRLTPFGLTRWPEKSDGQTPFGPARPPEKSEATAQPDIDKIPGLKITEEGDTLCFERPSPFGPLKWSRQKSELNEQEKAAWERAKSGAKQN